VHVEQRARFGRGVDRQVVGDLLQLGGDVRGRELEALELGAACIGVQPVARHVDQP
jgi:hypothetical protein